jgi:hypothetical protein
MKDEDFWKTQEMGSKFEGLCCMALCIGTVALMKYISKKEEQKRSQIKED